MSNAQLLHQVADAIEAEPEHFAMNWWVKAPAEATDSACDPYDSVLLTKPKKIHKCGTTACIGGWAIHLATRDKQVRKMVRRLLKDDTPTAEIAGGLLGLSDEDASLLLYATYLNEETAPKVLRRVANGYSVAQSLVSVERF